MPSSVPWPSSPLWRWSGRLRLTTLLTGSKRLWTGLRPKHAKIVNHQTEGFPQIAGSAP